MADDKPIVLIKSSSRAPAINGREESELVLGDGSASSKAKRAPPEDDQMDVDPAPVKKPAFKGKKAAAKQTKSTTPVRVTRARQKLVSERQREIEEIEETHDAAVRELFHLDKHNSLLRYDPAVAKEDDTEAFLDFQKQYDLYTHAAGSSSKAGMRTTRNALSARRDMLAGPSTSASSKAPARKGKGKASAEPAVKPVSKPASKAKGKAKAVEEDFEELEEIYQEAPPPVSSRARLARDGLRNEPATKPVYDSPSPEPEKPAKRKARPKKFADDDDDMEDVKPAKAPKKSSVKAAKPVVPAKRQREEFEPLISESYLKRLEEDPPDAPRPTHPLQMLDEPQSGRLRSFLDSHQLLGSVFEPKTDRSAEIEREARMLDQIDFLKSEGLLNLTDPDSKVVGDSKREADHADAVVKEAIELGRAFMAGRQTRAIIGGRLVKAISEYASEVANVQERLEKEQARKLKELARWTAKEVRKKWQMAVDVIRAKADAEEMAEQQRLGKIQLDEILEQSAAMLAERRQYIVEEEGDDSDDSSFDSTPETIVDTEDEDERDGDDSMEDSLEPSVEPSVEPEASSSRSPAPANGIEAGHDGSNIASSALLGASEGTTLLEKPVARPSPLQNEVVVDASIAPTFNGDTSHPADAAAASAAPVKAVAADDAEYASEQDEARDQDDAAFEANMHDEDAGEEDSDAEMNDLAAEADLPLEELLAKYNYRASPSPSVDGADSPALESSVATPSAITEEPAAVDGDVEFAAGSDAEREDEDAVMEEEMEGQESDASSDVEMKGLADDADLPLEELLGSYRPGRDPTPDTSEAQATPSEEADESKMDEDVEEERVEVEAEQPEEQAEEGEAEEEGAVSEAESGASPATIRVEVPFLLRGTLRPYQKGGLDWLASLYMSELNGILADEMGLGKTIQTISLLGWLAVEKGIWGPHLIVVPTSVMLNWEMEFKKFLPGFKILTYYGNAKERKEKRKGWNAENSFHVCITSYQICLADQHMFRRKFWHYMILDEAHHIKNFRSQRWQTLLGFNTERRLLLTGTPLQNNLMELWSLLYFLMPAHLNGGTGPFANHKDFLDWFSNPMDKAIESGEQMDDETKATVQRLHTILRPYLLRRLKADVEKQMPAKYEHIVYCRLSKRQRFLYDDFMSRAKTRETLASGNFMGVINCLMQLRKVCNHPDLFETRPVSTSFVMTVPAVLRYEPTELIVRKRLLDQGHYGQANLKTLGLVRTGHEADSLHASRERSRLDASDSMQLLLPKLNEGEDLRVDEAELKTAAGWRKHLKARARADVEARVMRMADVNAARCSSEPFMGLELAGKLNRLIPHNKLKPDDATRDKRMGSDTPTLVPALIKSYSQRADLMEDVVDRYAFATPAVVAKDLGHVALPGVTPEDLIWATEPYVEEDAYLSMFDEDELGPTEPLQQATTKLAIAFPDRALLQYDCGKLQKLHELLSQLVIGGHRALIFTQMTKVLDILETFLSFHGWRYLRLDGSTKVEDRQRLTERFNRDTRILCFISSTRAGGLGINLTGADTVVFYDSDWNPSMDRQCQDRCHRIGQTRDVHIYRFISEATIEENVLKKANQKRLLDDMVIAEGEFTTEFFSRVDWRDMLGEQLGQEIGGGRQQQLKAPSMTPQASHQSGGADESEMQKAFADAEDEGDRTAAVAAQEEIFVDAPDFSEQAVVANQPDADEGGPVHEDTPVPPPQPDEPAEEKPPNEIDMDADLEGTVDGWMVNFADSNWDDFLDLEY